MIIGLVAGSEIRGPVFQQQVDEQTPAYRHLPDMRQTPELVQALVGQGLPGEEGDKASPRPCLHADVVCWVGGIKGIGTLVCHNGKQCRAEAH